MAVESVVCSPNYVRGTTNMNEGLFYIASGISATTNYEIIDSWSYLPPPKVPIRYMGDPIADGYWVLPEDVGVANSWIIVQPTAPTYTPKWQVKLQSVNRYTDPFSDPSGHDYGYEGETESNIYWRFSPYGGWSFSMGSPDFDNGVDPDVEVSNNYQTNIRASETGKILLTCDQDAITFFTKNNEAWNEYDFMMYYFGDYVPKFAEQAGASARCAFGAYADGLEFLFSGDNGLLAEHDPFWSNVTNTGIWAYFLNSAGVGSRRRFVGIPMEGWMNARSQPNRLVSPYSLDLAPIRLRGTETIDDSGGVIYQGFEGILGDLRLYAKTFSPGIGTRFGSSSWLALGHNYSIAVQWDGTVDPY